MGFVDNIKNILKNKKETILTSFFSNRDLDKITDEVIDAKIIYYKLNSFEISPGCASYIKDDESFRDFATIACLIDFKIDEKAIFSDREKELLTEAAFNQYIYTKEKVGVDINSYIDTIDKNLLKIRTVSTGSAYDTISDNLDIDVKFLGDENNKEFYRSFLHELNHCYSYGASKYGFLNLGFGRGLGINYLVKSYLNELETEWVQLDMTKKFFPQFVEYEDFEIKFKDGISLQTQVNGNHDAYPELLMMGKMANSLIGNILVTSYLSKSTDDYLDMSVSKEVFNLMDDVKRNYQRIFNLSSKGEYNFEEFLKYEDIGAKLMARLIFEYNIPESQYDKAFSEPERFLVQGDEKISLNDRFKEMVAVYINEFESENAKQFGSSADEFKLIDKEKDKDKDFLIEYVNEKDNLEL